MAAFEATNEIQDRHQKLHWSLGLLTDKSGAQRDTNAFSSTVNVVIVFSWRPQHN